MQETPELDPADMADIISQSGCSDIQEAIAMIKKHGFSVEDLPPETLRSVLGVVPSAESIGAQAGITKQKK